MEPPFANHRLEQFCQRWPFEICREFAILKNIGRREIAKPIIFVLRDILGIDRLNWFSEDPVCFPPNLARDVMNAQLLNRGPIRINALSPVGGEGWGEGVAWPNRERL